MLEVTVGRITHFDADALVVYLMEGGPDSHPANATHAVDAFLGGALGRAVAVGTLTGRRGEVWTAQSQIVIVVGVGAAGAFDDEVAAEAVKLGCERAAALEARQVATVTLGVGRFERESVSCRSCWRGAPGRWHGSGQPSRLQRTRGGSSWNDLGDRRLLTAQTPILQPICTRQGTLERNRAHALLTET